MNATTNFTEYEWLTIVKSMSSTIEDLNSKLNFANNYVATLMKDTPEVYNDPAGGSNLEDFPESCQKCVETGKCGVGFDSLQQCLDETSIFLSDDFAEYECCGAMPGNCSDCEHDPMCRPDYYETLDYFNAIIDEKNTQLSEQESQIDRLIARNADLEYQLEQYKRVDLANNMLETGKISREWVEKHVLGQRATTTTQTGVWIDSPFGRICVSPTETPSDLVEEYLQKNRRS
jgi:hypothetical protein